MKKNQGFTLIEMLVVLLVISAVMLIALPDLRASGERGQETACEANQRLIRSQLDNYFLDHQNAYPPAETALSVLVEEGYLQHAPTCPAKGEYLLNLDLAGDSFTLSCSVHQELGAGEDASQ